MLDLWNIRFWIFWFLEMFRFLHAWVSEVVDYSSRCVYLNTFWTKMGVKKPISQQKQSGVEHGRAWQSMIG